MVCDRRPEFSPDLRSQLPCSMFIAGRISAQAVRKRNPICWRRVRALLGARRNVDADGAPQAPKFLTGFFAWNVSLPQPPPISNPIAACALSC